ncbi:peptidylprolyl isomerase [Candidatus Stoquefichus sp. SB1]|uniref:peptidylprolyl isomerase n=1 Tax=Candidatus Stoquefichus sp. SB1 TaxID=1658109 RepID=UPI00067F2F4D|nr:peptidylprolyl isomerase [Candidatus Stoquefichus sp. SB1]
MKQKRLVGLALASMIVLSGCSGTVKDNGKDVVASIDGKNILADDIYTNLSTSASGKQALFTYVLDQLIRENFPVTDDMKENASEIVTNIETNYKNQYGDEADTQLESALASSGYEDMSAYKDSLIQSLQYSEFLKKYVKANFDEVFEDYYKQESPRFMSLIKISMTDPDSPTDDEKEKLEEVKSLLKTNKSFADIASEYSDDDSKSAKGNIGVIDSTSGLKNLYGSDVEKTALSLSQGKVSEAIKGSDGYYFLYCTSTDKEKVKSELKTVDVDSPLLVYDDYMVYLAFKTYELKYSDEEIQNTIQKIVKESLEARDDLRKEKA